ncbi:MAG: Gfo/Idh/MocA family oxidoreductase [Planctomycetes bacterium]|nr:Gfo/Idh/MocA family oxidoreductase [Planctomycetota bacterium]
MQTRQMNRRQFLGGAAAVGVFTIVPRHILGGAGQVPPSEKLNIAGIGVAGMGAADLQAVSTENIIALCDVDWRHAAKTFDKYPDARKHRDFRKMLEAEDKNIDAVVVSTPDHIHAAAAMMAIKMGKHVYCQKPLCHNVYEVRQLTEAARKHKVMTQMGTQLHATGEMKTFVEWVKSGVIGKIRKVDIWSGKNWGGGERPTDTSPVPETLDWDLWLGPAPYRPYCERRYLPGEWRRWWDFGTGTLGDMGCHIIDPACWALDLGYPTSVEAQPGPFNSETYPQKTIVKWEFPARGELPAVTMTWYDGENRPPRPAELEETRNMPDQGGLYYGETGTILLAHGGNPRLIPESRMKDLKRPEPFLQRGIDHWQDWIRACKGGPKPLSNFDYAGPLTETILLGNIAALAKQKLQWDGPGMRVTNLPEANKLLRREYRKGWTL